MIQRAKKFGRRYPWSIWFKKKKFILLYGRDFTCLTHGMAGMVRNAASIRGVRVSLCIPDPDRIEVSVLSNEEANEENGENG